MPRLLTIALLLLLPVITGCGSEPARNAAPKAAFDPELAQRLPANVRAGGVLRIGTDASYAPASSFATDGRTIIGFEPDLADALGRVLGVRVRFQQTAFEDLLPQLRRERSDLVMSAMTDTAERERKADFVDYFTAGTTIVVQRGNPSGVTDLSSLCGRRVAVERGTVQVDLVERATERCAGRGIRLTQHATNADALVRLRTGRADAVLNDYPPAAHLVRQPGTGARYQLASTAQYEPGLYGIAVAKDRAGLRDAVQGAMAALLRSGEYQAILRRWDVQDGAVDVTTVNAGR